MQTLRCVSISLPVNAGARLLISRLRLVPLAGEGGFYAPTWTSPERRPDGRPLGSAILFLITAEDFSAFHRLRTDELWHFHSGDPAEVIRLDPRTGSKAVHLLGPDVGGGHEALAVVPAGEWQAARVGSGSQGWTLFGCTLSPAWDAGEFELGHREALLGAFPAHAGLIRSLTR